MRVSVALCTFNGERFVEQQVRSILNQSVPPSELVVSDDGSTDSTLDVIRGIWQSADGPAVILRVLENSGTRGVTANFERALSACSGEIIALSDQDDVWHPTKLERMLPVFAEHTNVLLVHSDARIVDTDGKPIATGLLDTLQVSAAERESLLSGKALPTLMQRNLVTGATAIVRRSLVELAAPFPDAWVHDEWLAITAAIFGQLRLLDERLIDYRQHASNQIGAEQLTGRVKLGRLAEDGTERNRRLLLRAQALHDRAIAWGGTIPPTIVSSTAEKLEHEIARSAYPASRIRRVSGVMAERSTGRYNLYGRGNADVVRDLMQPLQVASSR